MRMTRFTKAAAVVLGLGFAAQPAIAQVGELNIVGTVNLFQQFLGPTGNLIIDFVPPAGGGIGTVYTPPGVTGNEGVFAGIGTNVMGTQTDFVFGPSLLPTRTTTPVNILTIGGYTFTATAFGMGNTGTPVNIFENFGTTYATLSVQGTVSGNGLMNVPFVGGYSAQVQGTAASVLQRIENTTGGIAGVSVSATFTTSAMTPIPEPATFVLMGSGLVALAGVAVRRRRA